METFLYVIGPMNGPYKIGYSKTPNKRAKQLQTGHQEPLIVHYTSSVDIKQAKIFESLIHKNLVYSKIRGEWFDTTIDIAKSEIEFVKIRYGGLGDSIEIYWKNNLLLPY